MKQGDVFVIDGIEPLFIADHVTPSGAVYAHQFDIYKGTRGGTEAFPENTKFQVLFNSSGLSGSYEMVKVGNISLKDFVLSRSDTFMKEGTVFVVDGIEPLFIAFKVVLNEEVLAQKFDIYEGAYGGVEVFQSDTKFNILFNSSTRSGNLAKVKIGDITLEKYILLRKKDSLASANSTPLLEKRMRPGAYSEGGFLGKTESLERVLKKDEQVLKEFGIAFERLASELKKIIRHTWETEYKHDNPREHALASFEWYQKACAKSFPAILDPENLPSRDIGNLHGDYQVFFMAFRGLQNCPWDCQLDNTWSSFDFLLLNRQSGEYIFAPGLIVHLIQEHHFFEGNESPYRVEPCKLAHVLGLA
jgi:hypothetical protein